MLGTTFLVALRVRRHAVVDVAWGLGFVAVAVAGAFVPGEANQVTLARAYMAAPALVYALAGQFAQVQGALMIMELNDAAALNAAVMARVQQFAEGSLDGSGDAADMVADGLSALGLYITALQQGASSPREVMMKPTPTSGRKVTSDRSGQ